MTKLYGDEDDDNYSDKKKKTRKNELGVSCMLNTEVGAVLAVIRRPLESTAQYMQEDIVDSSVLHSLKSLRSIIFSPQQQWSTVDPILYIAPFLDVIQSDYIPAAATGVSLSAILKILKLEIFNEKTPGAKAAMSAIVTGITSCQLEKTDPISEDAVMMRVLQVLVAVMKHPASVLLNDRAVCTIVNTCFQIVQHSGSRGDLLQRNARYTMHELIHTIYSRLPDIEVKSGYTSEESDTEDADGDGDGDSVSESTGYGVRSAVDIFHFLCSLLNLVEIVETEGSAPQNSDEEIQLFALVSINTAIELSGGAIGKHRRLLKMVQDELFNHLITFGPSSSPLVLSMICSIVLNIYHFLRRSDRFFSHCFTSVASKHK